MSLLSKVFGGGKGAKAPSPQEAIQKLRETEEMLTKKQEFLENKIDQELQTAKKNGTKNKRGGAPRRNLLALACHAPLSVRADCPRVLLVHANMLVMLPEVISVRVFDVSCFPLAILTVQPSPRAAQASAPGPRLIPDL